MEKVIKLLAEEKKYILMINDNIIEINYESKTLDSKNLYEYVFKGCREEVTLNYVNEVEDFFATESYKTMNDDGNFKKKIISESGFIFSKIQELLDGIKEQVNTLLIDVEKNEVEEKSELTNLEL